MLPLTAERDYIRSLTNCDRWKVDLHLSNLNCSLDENKAKSITRILTDKKIFFFEKTTDSDEVYLVIPKESLQYLDNTTSTFLPDLDVDLLVESVRINLVNKILDEEGNTALHLAFEARNCEAVKYLMRFADIFLPNKKGVTPAQLACYSGFLPIIVNIKNDRGETPLFLLCISDETKKMEVLTKFIAAGGDIVGDLKDNIRFHYVNSPLRIIWQDSAHPELLKKIIELGFSQQIIMMLLLRDIKWLDSNIHIFEKHLESLEIDALVPFIERISHTYTITVNDEGNCVIKTLNTLKLIALTSSLIRKIMAASQKDEEGNNHIQRMVLQNRVDVVQIYVHLKLSKLFQPNERGLTLLDVALDNNREDIIPLLINLEVNFCGDRSLDLAVEKGDWNKVTKLYYWGANFCLSTKSEVQSLNLALKKWDKTKLSELFKTPRKNRVSFFYEALSDPYRLKDLLKAGLCKGLFEVSIANKCHGLDLLCEFAGITVRSLINECRMNSKDLLFFVSNPQLPYRMKLCIRDVFIDHMLFYHSETNPSPLVVKDTTPVSDNFMVHMHANNFIVPIDALLLFWVEAKGEVEILYDLLRSINNLAPSPRFSYDLTLRRSLLEEKPETMLAVLGSKFKEIVAGKIKVIFEGEPGIDEGGPGREFIHLLLTHFIKANRPKSSRETEELFFPMLEENLEGDFPPLAVSKRESYEYLGALLMFCCNTSQYPCGQQFDLSFFEALIKYPKEALHKDFRSIDFQDKKIFAQFLDVYRSIRELSESGRRMMTFIDGMLKDEQSTERLQEARKEIIETRFYPIFEIVHSILVGMRKAPFSWNYTMADLRKQSASHLFNLLQGRLSHENVIAKLVFRSPDNLTKTEAWLIEWITHATHEQLKSFVFALTGSEALGDSFTLTIVSSSQPANLIHTCSRTLELYEGHENEKSFKEALEFDLKESRKGFSAV